MPTVMSLSTNVVTTPAYRCSSQVAISARSFFGLFQSTGASYRSLKAYITRIARTETSASITPRTVNSAPWYAISERLIARSAPSPRRMRCNVELATAQPSAAATDVSDAIRGGIVVVATKRGGRGDSRFAAPEAGIDCVYHDERRTRQRNFRPHSERRDTLLRGLDDGDCRETRTVEGSAAGPAEPSREFGASRPSRAHRP